MPESLMMAAPLDMSGLAAFGNDGDSRVGASLAPAAGAGGGGGDGEEESVCAECFEPLPHHHTHQPQKQKATVVRRASCTLKFHTTLMDQADANCAAYFD